MGDVRDGCRLRFMHDIEDASIYRDADGGGGEVLRAIRQASAGLHPGLPLGDYTQSGAWELFYAEVFSTHLAGHLVAVHGAAVRGEWDEIMRHESRLAGVLEEDLLARQRSAASAVFEARAGARALRQLEKLHAASDGECCFLTAFAVHAAAFNIPLLQALIAYLSIEWRSGRGIGMPGVEIPAGWEKMFERELDSVVEPVNRVLARCLGNWADVA